MIISLALYFVNANTVFLFFIFIFRESQQDIFNAMGSMYAAVLFIGITNATAVQPVVSVERFVSYRERAAGMYSALPFAFAQVHLVILVPPSHLDKCMVVTVSSCIYWFLFTGCNRVPLRLCTIHDLLLNLLLHGFI